MIKKFNEYLMENEGTLTQEQKDWLDKCTSGEWMLNPSTGLVDVDGYFDCKHQGLRDFKGVKFGKVNGNFVFSHNNMTSLEGAPQEVEGNFLFSFNDVTSLEGSPRKVGGNFSCPGNRLTSLEGAPQEVGASFWCYDNDLTSLKGVPFIEGDIYLNKNPIFSLLDPISSMFDAMEIGSRNMVLQMIGRIDKPSEEDITRIMRSVERMNML